MLLWSDASMACNHAASIAGSLVYSWDSNLNHQCSQMHLLDTLNVITGQRLD